MNEGIVDKRKFIFILVGFGLLCAVIIFVSIVLSRTTKIPVTLAVVPSDATITLNGKSVSGGEISIKPGDYTLNASKPGFADYTLDIKIDQKNQFIPVLLTPVSPDAQVWARNNQDAYMKVEGKAGMAANQKGQTLRDSNPIIDKLPFSNLLFTIGYRADTSDPSGKSIVIEIDAIDGYRQEALNQLYQWGYDPTTLKIEFKNYQNPFK